MSNKSRTWFFGLEDEEGSVNENAPQIKTESTGEAPLTENTGVKTDTSDVQTTEQQTIAEPGQPAVEDLEVPS